MRLAVIGVGLIGGSIAKILKQKQLVSKVFGVDTNSSHLQEALELKIIDEALDLVEAVQQSDFIVIATPVDAAEQILEKILPHTTHQVIIDVGSTKQKICSIAQRFTQGRNFVATHPMWGTEFSGPGAATLDAFVSKAVVICKTSFTDEAALIKVEAFYKHLGMHVIWMSPSDHDVHVAYISHISHITSFALANTVLEKEKEENTIFELASSGFESTVRLAKSNPSMWIPILKENKENVLDVLNEHIAQLRKFKSCLEKENYTYLEELIINANQIKKILK